MASGDRRVAVLYDGECGFCAWGVAWLLRWDRAQRLRPVAIQSEEGARLLSELPEAQWLASWHARPEDGPLRSGGAAIAPVLERLPGAAPLAAAAARFPRASETLYGLIAAHRSQLGRLLPPASKARARARIAARMH